MGFCRKVGARAQKKHPGDAGAGRYRVGGRMDNCKVIQFPEAPKLPDIESFPIHFNHDSQEIMMPFVPDNREDAATVLGNFIVILLEDGIISKDDLYQVVLQATDDT